MGRLIRTMAAVIGACLFASTVAAHAAPLSDSTCDKARSSAFESRAVLRERPATIVAVGSSSTEGIARNVKSQLYPAAMEARLKQRWPHADIQVVNKGRGGEVMAETLRRFERDVLSLKPSLVIWQLGVNDVLRFDGVQGRRDEIRTGLRMLADHGIPVILLDLQYAPLVIGDPDTAPMQDLIDSEVQSGGRGRVFHFRRFATMKHLATDEAVAMATMTDSDGLHMTDAMHSCVGRLLADMVVAGVEVSSAPQPAR